MAWLEKNYGNTKVEIKPKYNGVDVIVLAEGRLVNLGHKMRIHLQIKF